MLASSGPNRKRIMWNFVEEANMLQLSPEINKTKRALSLCFCTITQSVHLAGRSFKVQSERRHSWLVRLTPGALERESGLTTFTPQCRKHSERVWRGGFPPPSGES